MYANLLKVLQIRQRTPTLNVKLHTDATLLTKTLIYKMIYLFQVVRRHLEKTTYDKQEQYETIFKWWESKNNFRYNYV